MGPSAATLPLIRTLQDCGDLQKTVLPYIGQLRELPWKILEASASTSDLKQLYLETNPLVTAFAFSLFLAPIFLIVSEINKNYSQVDRCWSILPPVYIGHYVAWAHMVDLNTRRLDNILGISIIWSLRLTFNYWRKGGYAIGSEDYRWEVLREYLSPSLFFIFNVAFISLAQSVLLFLITTPLYVFTLASGLVENAMSQADVVFSRALMMLILVEWFADQQQWNYHQAKGTYQKTAKVPPNWQREDLDRGFLASGLWAWSRHPNFAAEQGVWLTLYQWSCYETFSYYNWTCVGAIGYLLLFQASTLFTESITSKKYPEYKEYQKLVSKFLPKINTAITGPLPQGTPKKEPPATKGKAASKSKK